MLIKRAVSSSSATGNRLVLSLPTQFPEMWASSPVSVFLKLKKRADIEQKLIRSTNASLLSRLQAGSLP